ncbi:hypothetical protein CRP403_gp48 [Roseobacter phage CRP-403]|uniref:Uncharacterized protein n=1 Tax=Roseobacter phage CRP-403 TaxID=3072849 RepID=A0AAX3ZYB1_9CAUD|nr:hypothetical protein CRP403_gp48 [Roseobacter phage CRP-403]
MMVELTHVVDFGLLFVVAYVVYSLNTISSTIRHIAERHNELVRSHQEFAEAVVEDMEEIERFINNDKG